MSENLLEIKNLTKIYGGRDGGFVAIRDFNLTLPKSPATIVTIAGESGSGKSTLANLVLGFTKCTSGSICFGDFDVSNANEKQLKDYHRNVVQAIFQDPFGVYNPFYRVGSVFNKTIKNFKLASSKSEAQDMIEHSLNVVGLKSADILRKYPHQLSGGQRQRIMMARAYIIKPKLIVADEPVSMVDASLRASILDVMMKLRDEQGISFLYITHDLSTAYQIGDLIYLFYQGTVAEQGNAVDVISNPKHPYVQQLIDSVPKPDPNIRWEGDIELPAEESLRTVNSKSCPFYQRCPKRKDICLSQIPPLYDVEENGHCASCFLYSKF